MSARAKVKAREVLEKYFVEDPSDMDLYGIVNMENIMIKEEETKGHEGRIYIEGENAIITINSLIREKGRKNFTVAHEFGHYLLEKNHNHLCTAHDLLVYGEDKKTEQEANVFAT